MKEIRIADIMYLFEKESLIELVNCHGDSIIVTTKNHITASNKLHSLIVDEIGQRWDTTIIVKVKTTASRFENI